MTTQETSVEWVPQACTLPTVQQPLRVAEFDCLFAAALRGVDRVAPTTLRLFLDAEVAATARELVERETACCSFFTFAFQPAGEATVTMEVSVPDAYVDVLEALAVRVTSVGEVSG
jgi:hypothetical protein